MNEMEQKVKNIIGLLVLATAISGCASVQMESLEKSNDLKQFNPPSAKHSGLYIYRDSILGAALKKDIWVNGECLGESASSVFFYKEVLGNRKHVISTESEFSPNELDLTTEAGKLYFIRQYIKMGAITGGANLELIPEEAGKAAVSKLSLAQAGTCSK